MANSEKINAAGMIPFLLVHLVCFAGFWVGISPVAVWIAIATLFIRMFSLTAGYHRYFSHRSFRTNRVFQFILALIGTSAGQMGPLWWAAHHRHHHLHSDTEKDIHPPTLKGFWWSHMGWVLCEKYYGNYDFNLVRDLEKFPELRWINRNAVWSPFILGVILFVTGTILEVRVPQLHTTGAQLTVWGFFISTVILYHVTFSINSLSHTVGSKRFHTSDTSRNNFLLGLLTMGEGWHNNHHRYPSSERQGFFWWEIDIAHYILKILSVVGVVSDLKKPPKEAYQ